MECKPQNGVLLSIIVVVNIIVWMAMIAAIGLGAMHWNSCPGQPYIPVYLVVLGMSTVLSMFVIYIQISRKEGTVYILTSACLTILFVFNFCWFISGTVWVYAIYPPNYSPEQDGYCQKSLYQFAFFFTSILWLLGLVKFIFGGCFLLLTCYKIVFGRHSLSRMHDTSYGGTTFSEDTDYGQP